jgi:hypothetical protein
MTAQAYRSDRDIEQVTFSKCVLKHIGLAEGEQWQGRASKATSDVQCDALIGIFFRGREHQRINSISLRTSV